MVSDTDSYSSGDAYAVENKTRKQHVLQPAYKTKKRVVVKAEDYTPEQLQLRKFVVQVEGKARSVYFCQQQNTGDVNNECLLNYLKCYYRKVCPQCGAKKQFSSALLDHIVTHHLSDAAVASDCLYFYFMPLNYNFGVKTVKAPVLLPKPDEEFQIGTAYEEAVLCMELHLYKQMKRALEIVLRGLRLMPPDGKSKKRLKSNELHLNEINATILDAKKTLFKKLDDRLLDVNGDLVSAQTTVQPHVSDDESSSTVDEHEDDGDEEENVAMQLALFDEGTSDIDPDDNIPDFDNTSEDDSPGKENSSSNRTTDSSEDDTMEGANVNDSKVNRRDNTFNNTSERVPRRQRDHSSRSEEGPKTSPKNKRLKTIRERNVVQKQSPLLKSGNSVKDRCLTSQHSSQPKPDRNKTTNIYHPSRVNRRKLDDTSSDSD